MLGTSDGYMRFELEDVRVFAGDTEAVVTCVEVIDASDTRGRCAALARVTVWRQSGHTRAQVLLPRRCLPEGRLHCTVSLGGGLCGDSQRLQTCSALAPAGFPRQAQQVTVSTLRRSAAAGSQGGCDQRV